MRYIKPARKVFFTGSQAIFGELMRKQVPSPQVNIPSNEYPILLMHGFMGFSKMEIAGIKLFDYFNGVKLCLEQMGYTVMSPEVNPIDTPQNRAKQWAKELDILLDNSGAQKAHLICHSQGCLDARVLAADCSNFCTTPQQGELRGIGYGDKIASMTHLGGPHLGTILAETTDTSQTAEFFMDLIGLIAMMTGSPFSSAEKTVACFTPTFMKDTFNKQIHVPDHIPCYTVAGAPETEEQVGFMFDGSWNTLNNMPISEGGGQNDGFVTTNSAHFAGNKTKLKGSHELQWQSLGNIHADHVAMIGIPLELKSNNHFSHLPMFIGMAQHIDTCYKRNVQMALQASGEWLRHCALLDNNKTNESV